MDRYFTDLLFEPSDMFTLFKILLYLKISFDLFGINFLNQLWIPVTAEISFSIKCRLNKEIQRYFIVFAFPNVFFHHIKIAAMNFMINFNFGEVLLAVFKLNSFFFQKFLPLGEIKDIKNDLIQSSNQLLSSTWVHIWHGL